MSVPALRFKDDAGQYFPEWEETTLENCATFFRGGSLSKSDIDANGKFSCVHYGELFTTYNEIITNVKSKTNITNTINSEYGDVLMPSSDVTPAGLAKASCILKAGVVLGGDINVIRLKNTISPIFISYLLNFEKNKIIQLVSGTTVKHIYIKDIKTIELSIPTAIAEQTKIANFLTAVDEKITQLTQKHDLLTQYKKGVMQQIFSQELRFKDEDGQDFPEWSIESISKVIDNYGGTALEKYVCSDGTHNFISIGNYEKNGKYFDNGQRLNLNEKTKQKLLNTGDLVMVLNDKTLAGDLIGSTLLISEDDKFIYNQRSERLVCKESIVEPKFIWHLFNSIKFRKDIFLISQGGTQIYVNFPAVKKLKIPVPILQEQTKIANFLTAIDNKITVTQNQLQAVKQYKQGLLQQMFV